MRHSNQTIIEHERVRLRVLLLGMLCSILFLTITMWNIQISQTTDYERDLIKQSVRRVRLPGMRGRIFDREGVCLADNRPRYNIAIFLEELRQPGGWTKTIEHVEAILGHVSLVLRMPPEVQRQDILTHMRKRLPLPLFAWRNIDQVALARFSENANLFPGVDVYVEAERVYPQGALACHILGYVGRADMHQDPTNPFHYYLPEFSGKAGLERRWDGVLRGQGRRKVGPRRCLRV